LLDDLRLPATFFAEGRTLEMLRDQAGCLAGYEVGVHGYDHENLKRLEPDAAAAAITHSCQAVRDVTGRRPTCFRAPYLKTPRNLEGLLVAQGIRCDSSTYADAADCFPQMLPGWVAEVPVTTGRDSAGKKIAGYLWPLHEGARVPQDYVDMVQQVPEGGVLTLADHTWHLVEARAGGILSAEALAQNLDSTRAVLEGVLDAGLLTKTVSEAAQLAR